MWSIERLHAQAFRGVNLAAALDLHPQLTILLGANGTGKTSFAEAIEWILTGTTQKILDAAHTHRTSEFTDSIRNVHADASLETTVNVTLADDTQALAISRSLSGAVASPASDSGLPQLPWSQPPVALQHALRSFIDTEPAARWDWMTNALGLGRLDDFRDLARSTWTAFRKRHRDDLNYPKQAHTEAHKRGLEALSRTCSPPDPQAASAEVGRLVESCVGEPAAPENWRAALAAARLRHGQRTLPALFSHDHDRTYVPLEPTRWQGITESISTIAQGFAHAAVTRIDPELAKRMTFIRQGLDLITDDSVTCPFCGQDTLSPTIVARHRASLPEQRADSPAFDQAVTAIEELVEIRNRLERTCPTPLPETEVAAVSNVLGAPTLNDYHALITERSDLLQRLPSAPILTETIQRVRQALRSGASEADDLPSHLRTLLKCLHACERMLQRLLPRYQVAIRNLRTSMSAHLPQDEESQLLDQAEWAITVPATLARAAHVHEIENQLARTQEAAGRFALDTTGAALSERSQAIISWYAVLNPDEDVRLKEVLVGGTPARRTVNLMARSFDRTAHAAGILSESHLNAVGLSVYLSQITGASNPLRTVILDDPVQSMDELHTERFISGVVRRLLDEERQVVVLTHLNQFADDLYTQYLHLAPYMYRVTSAGRAGAQVTPANPLADLIAAVQTFGANPSNSGRMAASANLRGVLDAFSNQLHLQCIGSPMPPKGKGWRATAQRVELIYQGGLITAEDVGTLRRMIRTADPGTHLAAELKGGKRWAPPSPETWHSFTQQCTHLAQKYLPSETNRDQR